MHLESTFFTLCVISLLAREMLSTSDEKFETFHLYLKLKYREELTKEIPPQENKTCLKQYVGSQMRHTLNVNNGMANNYGEKAQNRGMALGLVAHGVDAHFNQKHYSDLITEL